MKRLLIISGVIFIVNQLFAQENGLTSPAGVNMNNYNTSTIPSASELKQAGATDAQIEQLMQLKNEKNASGETLTKESAKQQSAESKKTEAATANEPINDDLKIRTPADTTPEKIFGHSFFKNSNIKFYDKANQLRAPDNYILGVGDELSIAIWGYSDFNEVFKIDENGAINPRLVGRIYLKGLNFKDAKRVIAGKFGTVYDLNNSQMDVTLSYSKIITVNIVGEVNSPGSYTIPSINTAFNALVAAGGMRTIGSVRKIFVKRAGQTIKTLDVYEYLMNPDSKQDFFLENNDYILVPSSGKIVTINGQVKRPLGYELIENENLKSLIEYAGGFDAGAYRSRIQVKRFLNSQETIIDVDYDSLTQAKKDFELRNGDEVVVRRIPEGYSNYVELIGPVKLPGNYELKPGEHISDVIARAEGVSYDVFDNRAYIIRLNPDLSKKYIPFDLKKVLETPASPANIQLQNLDIIKVFSKSYFKDDFVFTVTGAVRSPGEYMYGEGITLKDALYLSGGLRKEAAHNRIEVSRAVDFVASSGNLIPIRTVVKTIEVDKNIKIDKASEAFVIQPYDQVFVRTEPNFELQKNIVIIGEVMYPGVYPILNKNEKLTTIIERAGGLTQFAFPEGATLKRNEFNEGFLFFKLPDVIKDSSSKYNYIVKGGDTLVIPKVDQLIQIAGAINYPDIETLGQISAPFTKRKSARYYIKNYGLGFGKDADKKKTYVLEAGGYVHRTKRFLFIKFYPRVSKGATVIVVKKPVKEKDRKKGEPVDWNKAIENVTIKLTGLATLWLIFTNLTK